LHTQLIPVTSDEAQERCACFLLSGDWSLEPETKSFDDSRQKKIRTLLELLKLEGKAFCQALYNLENVMNLAGKCQKPHEPRMAIMLEIQLRKLSKFALLLDHIGLRMSAIQLRKIEGYWDNEDADNGSVGFYRGLENAALQAHARIVDEISLIHIYTIKSSNTELIEEGSAIFGQDVCLTFPSSIYDLDEAANCLGMGRFTASIFHLMRSMEGAISFLCGKLGATGLNKDGKPLPWGILVSNIQGKIDELQSNDKDQWLKIIALLNSIRIAWRNDTMHPNRKYTEDEAQAIFSSVKSFMKAAAVLVAQSRQ
jgi:hypothetical protein